MHMLATVYDGISSKLQSGMPVKEATAGATQSLVYSLTNYHFEEL